MALVGHILSSPVTLESKPNLRIMALVEINTRRFAATRFRRRTPTVQ
jgi:hypothetical protein